MLGKYQFERTELRVLQITYPDNEVFLDKVAELIGKLTSELDDCKLRADNAEHILRKLDIHEG